MEINIYSSFEEAKDIFGKFEVEGKFSAFQSYLFLLQWYEATGRFQKHKLCFIYGSTDDEVPLIFLPLVIEYKGLFRCLSWQGGIFSDYQAPLLNASFSQLITEEEFKSFWDKTLTKLPSFDIIYFNNIPEYVGTQVNPFLSLSVYYKREDSYSLVLPEVDSWEKYYLKNIKKSIRSDSRRQKRRLSELGNLEFIISKSRSDIKNIIEIMIAQKRRRYQETGAKDIFKAKRVRDFYLQTSLSLTHLGVVQVSALKLNGEILATHWGVINRSIFYYLMPTYEGGEWQKYSCGRLLLEHLLEWSFENGMEKFDFTGGNEKYKKDWCNHKMKLYNYISSNSCIGYLLLIKEQLKRILKNNTQALNFFRNIRKGMHPFSFFKK